MGRLVSGLGPIFDIGAIFGGEEASHAGLFGPGDEIDLFLDAASTDAGNDCVNACLFHSSQYCHFL